MVVLTVSIITYFEDENSTNVTGESNAIESTSFSEEQNNLEMEIIAYKHAELKFNSVNAIEVNNMIENDTSFFLYTGRVTCQWCRKMVPILNSVIKEKNITMYYLDSESTDKDLNLSAFRKKYSIDTVPSIIYFKNGEVYLVFDLDVTVEDPTQIENSLKKQFEKIILD